MKFGNYIKHFNWIKWKVCIDPQKPHYLILQTYVTTMEASRQRKERMNQQRKDEPTLQERKYLSENGKITLLQTEEFQMSEGLVLFRN